ncbi:Rho GTPase-activating protein 18 [Bulinus truncatus]|nr:Rho GTPase-activating protein 18 [Bulinus truncatus]
MRIIDCIDSYPILRSCYHFVTCCQSQPVVYRLPSDAIRSHSLKHFPDKYNSIADWNCLLNITYGGLLRHNVRALHHMKQLVGPQVTGLREFHTTFPVSCRPHPLIPYESPKDRLGRTYISDLGEKDAERMQKIAYYELKKLLEGSNIEFTKVKFRRKTSDRGVFGTSLEALVNKDIKKDRLLGHLSVPTIFSLMVRHIEDKGLETEGIFRVSGSSQKVEDLKADLTANFYRNTKYPYYTFDKPDLTIHDVASTLKAFLRELPTPLMTSNRLQYFPDVSSIPFGKQIEATNLFILSMFIEYRDTLQVFLRLMNAIIENKTVNKMDDYNLATCLTPAIFAMSKKNSPDREKETLQEQFGYFRIMASYHKKLFVVPPKLLKQIRKQYEDGDLPMVKRKFSKEKSEKEILKLEDARSLPEIDIEVHAPFREKKSAVFKINVRTTAKEIVDKYQADVASVFRSRLAEKVKRDEDRVMDYLYEVGGNIEERCIDPDTRVMEVFRANPAAEWVIKTKKGR